MRHRLPLGGAFTAAGSATGAPSNLLLFIFPGSKVLIDQHRFYLLAQGLGLAGVC